MILKFKRLLKRFFIWYTYILLKLILLKIADIKNLMKISQQCLHKINERISEIYIITKIKYCSTNNSFFPKQVKPQSEIIVIKFFHPCVPLVTFDNV